LSRRALMILLAAAGRTNREIAIALRADVHTVGRWRKQFLVHRLKGIATPTRAPGLRTARAQRMARKILKRTREAPPRGSGRWTTRTLADELGVSHSTIRRVWKAAGIHAARRNGAEAGGRPASARRRQPA
jgi:transposase